MRGARQHGELGFGQTGEIAGYAARRFRREHWQLQPETVARAIREAEEHAQSPDALAALIETELDAG